MLRGCSRHSHAMAVQSAKRREALRVPSRQQSPAYYELYCYSGCTRHVRGSCPNTGIAFVAAYLVMS